MIASPTITPLHRLAAVLRLVDGQPAYATHVPIAEVRALLVGNLAAPTYTAQRTDMDAWLWTVMSAAEVVAWEISPSVQCVAAMRDVLARRPDGGK